LILHLFTRIPNEPQQDDVVELYSVSITGSTPVRLNDPFGNATRLLQWDISPDNSHVVYIVEQQIEQVSELYSVSIAGGRTTKLNGALINGGSVYSFQISADGSHVVYRADQQQDNVFELYSVPIVGGPQTKLNEPVVSSGGVGRYEISPDSSLVIFLSIQQTDGVQGLYSTSINGGTPTKLNGALVARGGIYDFQISPDNSHVVYSADQQTDNFIELYGVPITGGTAAIKLSGEFPNTTIPPFRDYGINSFQISPDSSRVVYRQFVEPDDPQPSIEPVQGWLSNVSIDGGDVTHMFEGQFGVLVQSRFQFYPIQMSPDGRRVIYTANATQGPVFNLYSELLAGGVVLQLNNGQSNVGGQMFSPDSNHVVYIASRELYVTYEQHSLHLPFVKR